MKGKQKQHKVIHHAHRYEQFDEAFLRYLARHLPGFKRQPKEVRLALCGMIYEAPPATGRIHTMKAIHGSPGRS